MITNEEKSTIKDELLHAINTDFTFVGVGNFANQMQFEQALKSILHARAMKWFSEIKEKECGL